MACPAEALAANYALSSYVGQVDGLPAEALAANYAFCQSSVG